MTVVVALVAAGCSSGGDERSADTTMPAPDLESCAALTDGDEARARYAEALSALIRDADDPGPALEEIAVAAYTDPSGRLLGDCTGSCTRSAASTPPSTGSRSRA
jgi:hypothetical protein